ncbi:MAG: hypothetical protein MUO54_03865 [Anaerolineales bacterium]|nr:hypothetical protein [Anaerolineales bacterium]
MPLFILVLIIGTSCQPKVNVEKEKEAILAVIQEESNGVAAMDQDRVYATHIQSSEEMRLELGVYGYRLYDGWDEIESLFGDFLTGGNTDNIKISKENVAIKVNGTAALLTCDNFVQWGTGDDTDGYSNIQIVFLEKVKGEWKISFTAYYSKPVEVPGIDESFSGSGGL